MSGATTREEVLFFLEEHPAYLIVEETALVAVDKDPLYRRCLVVDTGCSCSVSSMTAADLLQIDRLEEEGSLR